MYYEKTKKENISQFHGKNIFHFFKSSSQLHSSTAEDVIHLNTPTTTTASILTTSSATSTTSSVITTTSPVTSTTSSIITTSSSSYTLSNVSTTNSSRSIQSRPISSNLELKSNSAVTTPVVQSLQNEIDKFDVGFYFEISKNLNADKKFDLI